MSAGEVPKSIKASLYIDGKPAESSITGVTQVTQALRRELNGLTIGTAEFIAKSAELQKVSGYLSAVRAEIKGVSDSMGAFKEGFAKVFETLGIGIGVAELINFGKELVGLEVKASGIENAFSKIGNTVGMVDKLREASRGLISDLDLQKIAIKANNANVPLEKMGTILKFVQQRARDMGGDVTELTEKLLKGLGKGNSIMMAGRDLSELGISLVEVKEEFARTGDMVTAVTNIINRQMLAAGNDVDNFGDRVLGMGTKWENFKDKLAGLFQKVFFAELADPEGIANQTDKELAQFKGYQKFEDDKLAKAIKQQQDRVDKWAAVQKNAQKQMQAIKDMSNSDRADKAADDVKNAGGSNLEQNAARITEHLTNASVMDAEARAKADDEGGQGARNALSALQKEQEKRTVSGQKDEDAAAKQAIKDAAAARKLEEFKRQQQEYLLASKSLSAQLKEFNASELADTLSKDEKEVKSVQNKYDQEIQKLQEFVDKSYNLDGKLKSTASQKEVDTHKAQIDQVKIDKAKATNDLIAKQQQALNERILEFNKALEAKVQSERDKEIEQINKKYDAEVKDAGTNAAALASIEIGRAQAINTAKLNEEQRFQDEMRKISDEAIVVGDKKNVDSLKGKTQKIRDEAATEIAELKKKFSSEEQDTEEFWEAIDMITNTADKKVAQAKMEDAKAWKTFAVDQAEQTSSLLFATAQSNRQNDTNAEIKNLETQKEAQLNNANLTETQKAAITANFAKQEAAIKLQQWEADKQAAVEKAIIDGALAVLKVYAETGALGLLAVVPVVAATALQVASIESQSPPDFADGGMTDQSPAGYVGQPTIFKNSASGQPFRAGEAGTEWIAPNWMVKSPRYANIIGMLEGARQEKRSYAAGGFNGASPSAAAGGSDRLDRIESVLHGHSQLFEKQAIINTRKVVISRRAWEQEDADVVAIRDAANAS